MKVWDNKIKGMVELTPSPIGKVIIMKANGSKFKHPANRAERRRLLREERKRQKHEHSNSNSR